MPDKDKSRKHDIKRGKAGIRKKTDSIIIHRTAGSGNFNPKANRLAKEGYGAHFTINPDGSIDQVGNIDWKMSHAGPQWNGRSIGIEIVGEHLGGMGGGKVPYPNPDKEGQWAPLTPAQEATLKRLSGDLVKKYNIPSENIMDHYNATKGTKYGKTLNEGSIAATLVRDYIGSDDYKVIKDDPNYSYVSGVDLDTTDKTIKKEIEVIKKDETIIPSDKKKIIDKIERRKSNDELSTYKEYSIDLAEQRDNLFKKKITQEVYDENVKSIKTDYQKEYGDEFLKKGNELYNEEVEQNFYKTDKNGKSIVAENKKILALTRKKDSLKDKNLFTPKDKNLLKQATERRDAAYSNIQIKKNDEIIKRSQAAISNLDPESGKYKEAVANLNKSLNLNKEIKKGFRKDILQRKNNSDKGIWNSLTTGPTTKKIVNNSYHTGNVDTDIESELGKEKYVSQPIIEDDNDGDDGDDGDDDGDDKKTKEEIEQEKKDAIEALEAKKKSEDALYDFNKTFNSDDFKTKDPFLFTDDENEKGSVKDFLGNNPTALITAGLGVKGIIDSQSDVPSMKVEDQTSLSDSFYEYLNKLEEGSKRGFTPAEEAAYNKKINDGYMASVDLAIQASGGSRAQVLNQVGQLNSKKNNSLLDFSSADAKLQRDNQEKYGRALEYEQGFEERKDIRRQTNEYAEKNANFNEAIAKREGGAVLGASAIKSLVDSINTYKSTGTGSALNKFTTYMEKKRVFEGQGYNSETGKNFANQEELDSFNKRKVDKKKVLGNFVDGFKNWDTTTEIKQKAKGMYEGLTDSNKEFVQNDVDFSKGETALDAFKTRDEKEVIDLGIEESGINNLDLNSDLNSKII
jgi:hypothetical protein